jgi:hypothetical protein
VPRKWLLFVHQLPSSPSNIRVRTWRRLQQIGAIVVKQAVYVLPDSPGAREDFEWLKTEIEAAGGQASVFAADNVDTWSDDALVEEFRHSRQAEYAQLARDIEQVGRRLNARRAGRSGRPPGSQRLLEGFRQRFAAVERTDFFGSAGRDRVATLLEQFGEQLLGGRRQPSIKAPHGHPATPEGYQQRLWVTRPRPGVDRMACAWLIQRFIDPQARFGFVTDRDAAPREAIPFDMFGVDFSHRGEHCTFETLSETFGVRDAAVTRVAAIVHDLDLKDGRFGAPEASAIATVIEGLQLAYADDDALLAQGVSLFEALYRAFEQSGRPAGPRPVARRRTKRRTSSH